MTSRHVTGHDLTCHVMSCHVASWHVTRTRLYCVAIRRPCLYLPTLSFLTVTRATVILIHYQSKWRHHTSAYIFIRWWPILSILSLT